MAESQKRTRVEVHPGKFSELSLLASAMLEGLGTLTLRQRPVDRCTRRELAALHLLPSVAPARRVGNRP